MTAFLECVKEVSDAMYAIFWIFGHMKRGILIASRARFCSQTMCLRSCSTNLLLRRKDGEDSKVSRLYCLFQSFLTK